MYNISPTQFPSPYFLLSTFLNKLLTTTDIKLLKDELSSPKYGEYHICMFPLHLTPFPLSLLTIPKTVFSNTLKNVLLEELAQADEHEVVKEVQVCSPPPPPFCHLHYLIMLHHPLSKHVLSTHFPFSLRVRCSFFTCSILSSHAPLTLIFLSFNTVTNLVHTRNILQIIMQ